MSAADTPGSPVERLLTQARELGPDELGQLLAGLLDLRTQGRPSLEPLDEAALLDRIRHWIHPDVESRYRALKHGFDQDTLTPAEYEEYLELSDRREWLHAERLRSVAELARRRGMATEEVMAEQGMLRSSHA